jgi:GGDEF domain-containing protein
VQHLYYVPITLAAASFGTTGGSIVSIAAIVLYHLANPRLLALGHEHWDIVRVALFLAVGLFTAKLTADKRRLHALATTDDLTGLHNLKSFEARLAPIVAEEIRGAVSAVSPVLAGCPFPPGTLTVSIGVASRVPEASEAHDEALGETLFRLADAALCRAKAGGRNGGALA